MVIDFKPDDTNARWVKSSKISHTEMFFSPCSIDQYQHSAHKSVPDRKTISSLRWKYLHEKPAETWKCCWQWNL